MQWAQAFQVPGGPEGQLVMKYACGLAVLWTPFFWLGHWAAGWGGLLYGLMGLGLLRRVLLWYFSDAITTVVLVLLMLGSTSHPDLGCNGHRHSRYAAGPKAGRVFNSPAGWEYCGPRSPG